MWRYAFAPVVLSTFVRVAARLTRYCGSADQAYALMLLQIRLLTPTPTSTSSPVHVRKFVFLQVCFLPLESHASAFAVAHCVNVHVPCAICVQTTGKVPLTFLAEDTKLRASEKVVMASADAAPDSELWFRQGQYIIATMTTDSGSVSSSGGALRGGKAHGRLPDGSQGLFDTKCVVVVDA